jgi:hypothetical protein
MNKYFTHLWKAIIGVAHKDFDDLVDSYHEQLDENEYLKVVLRDIKKVKTDLTAKKKTK